MLSDSHGGLVSHAGAFCPVHQCPNSSEATSWETAWETHLCRPRCGSPPLAHPRQHGGGCARLARHRAQRIRLRGRRNIGVGSKRVATSWGSPTRTASTGGRAEHRWREKPQTTGRHYAPCHRSLQTTQYTYGGEAWATMGYPHSIHRFHVKRSVWHWIHVQCRFRDTFASSLLEIPGVSESSQRAALDSYSLIRTAGIVGS